MVIRAAADLLKALQTPKPELSFQLGYSQLKEIMILANIFYADTQIPNRYALPTPPSPLMKKIYKLPRVEDHTDPPPREYPDEESKYR